MDASALTPGQFIKAADLGVSMPKNPTLTIKSAAIEEMASLKPGSAEKTVEKGVIFFEETKRGWVMNKTNVECLKALFGARTEGWIGKRVTLKTEPTNTGPGIRVLGSPDISTNVVAIVRLPRKKPITMVLQPTGGKAKPRSQRPEDVAFRAAIKAEIDAGSGQDEVMLLLGGRLSDDVPEAERAEFLEKVKALRAPPPAPELPPEVSEDLF